MIGVEEKKMLLDEYARCERCYEAAYERYMINSSRSAVQTMHKYRLLMAAIKMYLDSQEGKK